MITKLTKDNFKLLYNAFVLTATSLVLDILIPICDKGLKENPERSNNTTNQPPHFVVMNSLTVSGNRSVCQLRRYDNNKWLWTSKQYSNSKLAERDAIETANRFGWQILK